MQQSRRYPQVSRAVLFCAGLLLLGGYSEAQIAQKQTVPDAQIEANVLKALAGAPELANENITSNTVYGTVTLSGTVKDEPTRRMAETLVSKAQGVQKVVDELTLPSETNTAEGGLPPASFAGAPQEQPGQAHAPDPDTYAAMHGMGPDDGQGNAPAPGNPPEGAAGNGPAPYPQQGAYRGPRHRAYGAQVAGQPVTIPPGALLRIRINEGLDSKHAQPGTTFDAIVLNDVVAGGAVAIPRGASVQGVVVDAKSGGVIKGHGELQLRITQVTLAGQNFPITSDIWTRDSADKSGQTIGNAVGLGAFGALIGAVAGGGPGAAIGAAAGGAAGVGTSAASGSRQVVVPSEAILTFHLTQPAPVTTVSQAEMDRLSSGVPAGAQPRMQRRYPPPPPPYYGPVYYYPRPY